MSNPTENTTKQETPAGERAPAAPTPEDLVRRFRGGDPRAFDDLVLTFQARVFGIAYRMVNRYEEAADLTQEIFVKVYRSLPKFRGESSFSTWLFAIALNMCRTGRRRMRRRAEHEVQTLTEAEPNSANGIAMDWASSPVELLKRKEIRDLVQNCLAALPPEFRAVMVLRDVQGMSGEETAAILDCSLGTVKSRLSRARLQMRKALKAIVKDERR